jgi:hypothetical protein
LRSIRLGLSLLAPVSLGFFGNDPPVADFHVSRAVTTPPRRVKVGFRKAVSPAKFPDAVACSLFHIGTRLLVKTSNVSQRGSI